MGISKQVKSAEGQLTGPRAHRVSESSRVSEGEGNGPRAVESKSADSDALSARDLQLKRFIELDAEVKRLTKELDALKESFKHEGSFSTRHFLCIVEERERTNPPAVSILVDKFGPSALDLCSKSTYKTVKVTRKGEGGAE